MALQVALAAIEADQHAQSLHLMRTSPESIPALVELTRVCQNELAAEETRLARLSALRVAQRQAELDAAFYEQVAAFKATAPLRHARKSVEDLFAPRASMETVMLSPTVDEAASLDLFLDVAGESTASPASTAAANSCSATSVISSNV